MAKKTDRQDELAVQATNNSSFMSKASMVQLGYVPSQHLGSYKIFLGPDCAVKRRAPLINRYYPVPKPHISFICASNSPALWLRDTRGYYIRHRAIHHFVELLKRTECNKQLQILSLGCGYDPLFFDLIGTEVLLVECDFQPVVNHKIKSLSNPSNTTTTHQFTSFTSTGAFSKNYHVVSCNLMDPRTIESAITDVQEQASHKQWPVWDYEAPTLVISECVLTYLPTVKSNQVLWWTAQKFPCSMMVLYEQIYPDDSFARTMLKHFDKNMAKIFAIHDYPNLADQKSRLINCGFQQAWAMDMVQWWHYLGHAERKRIDGLELFDEYEEWFMKCPHYFVSCGVNGRLWQESNIFEGYAVGDPSNRLVVPETVSKFDVISDQDLELKRWGHSSTRIDDKRVVIFGGFGVTFPDSNGNDSSAPSGKHFRLSDCAIYDLETRQLTPLDRSSLTPPARIYHQCVKVGAYVYLFGGRMSPSKPFNDLWRFSATAHQWEKLETAEVPSGRYNHAFVNVSFTDLNVQGPCCLLFGGRRYENGDVREQSDFWLLTLTPSASPQWKRMPAPTGDPIPPLHRMSLLFTKSHLFIIGGLVDGFPNESMFRISLRTWNCERLPGIALFGAKVCPFTVSDPSGSQHDLFLLVGGICGTVGQRMQCYPTVFAFNPVSCSFHAISKSSSEASADESILWVNHDVVPLSGGDFMVLGGGATCFSMGTYFQQSSYRVSVSFDWRLLSPINWVQKSIPIRRMSIEEFKSIKYDLKNSKVPFIVENVDFGDCLNNWSRREYVEAAHDGLVSVHESKDKRLTFCPRNYKFSVMPWSEFISSVWNASESGNNDSFLYLRSIGANPRKEPADFVKSFPGLAKDVQVPHELISFISSDAPSTSIEDISSLPQYHSLVFRVSSAGLQLWTHYDIMDNFLMQIGDGEKFVSLFKPEQFFELGISNEVNSSSSPISDIFLPYDSPFGADVKKGPDGGQQEFIISESMTDILKPGDCLFIPAMWFHNVYTIGNGPALSLNLFWKGSSAHLYDRKDLYGNKDLLPAAEAFQYAKNLKDCLDTLPDDFKSFYLSRLSTYISQ